MSIRQLYNWNDYTVKSNDLGLVMLSIFTEFLHCMQRKVQTRLQGAFVVKFMINDCGIPADLGSSQFESCINKPDVQGERKKNRSIDYKTW